MKNVKLILIWSFMAIGLFGFAQNDSLKAHQLFDQGEHESDIETSNRLLEESLVLANQYKITDLRIEIKKLLAQQYMLAGEGDQALRSYFQLVNMLNAEGRYLELFEAYVRLSNYYRSNQLPNNSAAYRLDALQLADSNDLEVDYALLYFEIGELKMMAQEFDESMFYLLKADSAASQVGDLTLLLKTLRLQAKNYERVGDVDNSVVANERILKLLDPNDVINYTNQLNNLGFIEQKRGNREEAIKYFLETLEIRELNGYEDKDHVSLLVNIGVVYRNMKRIEEAKTYLERALKVVNPDKNLALAGEIYDLISVAYLNEDDLYNAILYNKSGLGLMNGSTPEVEMELALTASIIYERMLEYETALEYYRHYLDIKDSLDLDKRLTQEEILQQQLYVERTEKEIQALVDKSEIKDYQLEQLRLESENKDIQLENQKLDAQQKLQAARLRESELEKEKAEQELVVAEAQKKNQELLIKQQQLEKDKVEKQNLLLEKDAEVKDLELARRRSLNQSLVVIAFLAFAVMVLALFAVTKIRKSNKIINAEKAKSDSLLLNILPESTAEELKQVGQSLPRKYENVTVLFTDFKGFTKITETMQPENLVGSLDRFFAGFDDIMKKHGLEKIKTIGDAYMCAGGIPDPIDNAAEKTVMAAKEMLALTEEINADKRKDGLETWGIRIGVHTGPVVAGVIGNYKFQYDIWGDTVNLAARMESSGEEGKINISETTFKEVEGKVNCTYRGEIAAKNKGKVKMYFVD